ncbi:hypothetical protein [Thiorhodococcus minor]|uniref:hypothetical protein n=1 Tax=Thiorhodococcus minor TaxID=57489 RepID=UPI002475F1F8|nr:hypothetical protein [Thiorhodococcus minor]
MSELDNDKIRQVVRDRYAVIAQGAEAGCCGPSTCCGTPTIDTAGLSQAMGYDAAEVLAVPEGANLGLGCGNPQAIASLKPGETCSIWAVGPASMPSWRRGKSATPGG